MSCKIQTTKEIIHLVAQKFKFSAYKKAIDTKYKWQIEKKYNLRHSQMTHFLIYKSCTNQWNNAIEK